MEKRLAEHQAAYERDAAAARTEAEAKLAGWRDAKAPQLAANLKALADQARKGRPVSRHDIARAAGAPGYDDLYRATLPHDPPPEIKPYSPPKDLTGLRQLLTVAKPGSTVSMSALEKAGLRALLRVLE